MSESEINLQKNRLIAIARQLYPGFLLDDYSKSVLTVLFAYFHHLTEFEEYGNYYSLNKGLLLCGNVGSGKSLLMRIFQKYVFAFNFEKTFRFINVVEIENLFAEKGEEALEKLYFCDMSDPSGYVENRAVHLCMDDLGLETGDVKHYGTTKDIAKEIIFRRYEMFQRNNVPTHGTTNLNAKQMLERYGERLHIPGKGYQVFR